MIDAQGNTIPDTNQQLQPAQPVQPVQPIQPYTAPTYTPGQNFTFNSQQYLPAFQNEAASIYQPQQAQIAALSNLSKSQAEQAQITTKEQFAKQMQSEIEAINARGAFFGGGGLQRQSDIGTAQTRALTDITSQQQAAQAGFAAQQAGLSAQQAQYIQDKLSGAQNSAYSQWKDAYGMYQDQQQLQRQAILDQQERQRYEDEQSRQKKATKEAAKKTKKEFALEYAKIAATAAKATKAKTTKAKSSSKRSV